MITTSTGATRSENMAQINFNIKGACTASLYATKNVLGKDVEANKSYILAPGSAQISADRDVFSFSGSDIKEGYIRADIKTDDVRSLFINIQRMNIGLVVGGIIMIVAGAILALFGIVLIFVGVGVIIAGIVMLVKGLVRSVCFSVRVTSHLYNFVTITVRSISGSTEFKEFIESFWIMVRGGAMLHPQPAVPSPAASYDELVQSAAQTVLQQPTVHVNPVAPQKPVQAERALNFYTCNVCMESFDGQEELLNHKRETGHW